MVAPGENSPAPSSEAPDWVRDAVFYQIFPDRFARSEDVPKPANLEAWDIPPTIHGFKGGDLIGVVNHLDYLSDLGVTALYLCPVFRSTANHRYHTHDYYVVDPLLGGNDALARLLREAHRRDMRVILDGVFNHASRGFYQFSHILENGQQSPFIDWFTVESWPLRPYGPPDRPPGYACWWGNRELPEFNTTTPAVREFLWDVGQHWIEIGVDGWRLDVPNEIDDDEFWREFRRRVKGANRDAYIVGEIWGDARRWLAGDQFDAVMNYMLTRACLGFFIPSDVIDYAVIQGTGLNPVEPLDAGHFGRTMDSLLGLYPPSATLAQLNLLDSHDTARFLTMARGDESALRLASLFIMCFPGAPCIYYGDEIGMQGGQTVEEARKGFEWKQECWNEGLLAHYKSIASLRHRFAMLRRGSYRSLHADNGVYAFMRQLDGDTAVIALNVSNEERRVALSLPEGVSLASRQLIWGEHQPDVVENSLSDWLLPSRSASILVGSDG